MEARNKLSNKKMLVPIYQVLIPLLCIVMIVNNWMRHKAGEFNLMGFLFWSLMWAGLGVLAVFPDWAAEIAGWTGIKDSFRALVIIGLVAAFYLLFNMRMKMATMKREMTRIIRECAVIESEGGKRRKK